MLSELSGADAVTHWFGSWPSFHDAEVISVFLARAGQSVLRVYPFHPQKPATVDFILENVTDVELVDFSCQNVINSLEVATATDQSGERIYRLTLAPCYGLAGRIDAKSLRVELRPGKSPDDASHRVLTLASQAMCEGRFDEADRELNTALLTCSDKDESDLLLQQLVHLYSHPQNKNLAKAQMYMDRRETDQPSAHVALSQSYFQLYTQANFSAAQHWAEVAIQRAEMEKEWSVLFSANAVCGLAAKQAGDRTAIISALDAIEPLIGKHEEISYGDVVPFLEAMGESGDETGHKARYLAGLIAPLIVDQQFRNRAETVARLM